MKRKTFAVATLILGFLAVGAPAAHGALGTDTGPLCSFWFDQFSGTLTVSCKAYGNECGVAVTISDKRLHGMCDL